MDTIQADIDKILEHVPPQVEVEITSELPTGSIWYNTSEPISLRPMTFEDEQAIIASKNENVENVLISRCLKGIPFSEIVNIDKLWILMKIRAISFGPIYEIKTVCPNCEAASQVPVDITQFHVDRLPPDLEEKREVIPPGLQKPVVVRCIRAKDEKFLSEDKLYNNLWRFIVSIDGKDDQGIIAEVVKRLPLKDLKVLVNEIGLINYGVNRSIMFICHKCKHSEILEVPLDADFFSVN